MVLKVVRGWAFLLKGKLADSKQKYKVEKGINADWKKKVRGRKERKKKSPEREVPVASRAWC